LRGPSGKVGFFRVFTKIGSTFWVAGQFLYHKHEISDRKNIIVPYIRISGLWPDYGRSSMERKISKKKIPIDTA
jgi:hypothetical protein